MSYQDADGSTAQKQYELQIVYPCRHPTVTARSDLTVLEDDADKKVYDYAKKAASPQERNGIDMSMYYDVRYMYNSQLSNKDVTCPTPVYTFDWIKLIKPDGS